MKHLFALIALLPCLCFGQLVTQLKTADHTYSLHGDSLTVFQEAQFYSIVPWYADSDTITLSGNITFLNVYYKPEPFTGNFPKTTFTQDTFAIDGLSTGSHTLIVNSYEWGAAYDSSSSSFYEFYTLRDSDTSHFQVLSDGAYLFEETPLSFYPNPASDHLNVKGLKSEEGTLAVSIRDLQGREILRSTVSSENPNIEITDLPGGIYLISVGQSPLVQKLRVR